MSSDFRKGLMAEETSKLTVCSHDSGLRFSVHARRKIEANGEGGVEYHRKMTLKEIGKNQDVNKEG